MTILKYILLLFSALMLSVETDAHAATMAIDDIGFIDIVGPIVDGDYDRFVDTIKSSKKDVYNVLTIGPGGNTNEALKIGRLIRKLNLSTFTLFTEDFAAESRQQYCSMAANVDHNVECLCASACTLIWFAGNQRSGNDLLIHSARYDYKYFGGLSAQAASSQFKVVMKDVKDYFDEMDVPMDIYNSMFQTPAAFVQRMPIQQYYEVSAPIPAYREWINAKCNAYAPTSNEYSMCWLRVSKAAAVDAVNDFRQQNAPAPAAAPSGPQPVMPSPAKNLPERSDIYTYNGSTFYMQKVWKAQVFYYKEPRQGLEEAGIKHGTPLFGGELKDHHYKGKAAAYTKNCPLLEYEMQGDVSDDGSKITLTGMRPKRDERCAVTGYKKVSITFEKQAVE